LRNLCHHPPRFARTLTLQTAPSKDFALILVHMITDARDPSASLRFPVAALLQIT
jgi:hypothetical protein